MSTFRPSQSSTLLLTISLLATPLAFGQAAPAATPHTAAARPSFEVATIKPMDMSQHPGALTYSHWENYPPGLRMGGSLQVFIERAYGVRPDQVLGGPAWTKDGGFEILAKSPAPASPAQINTMLRTLLEDRFKLAVHNETRQGSEYSLVAAKGGSKLKPAAPDAPHGSGWGATSLRGTMTTAEMAATLSSILGHPVADNSGLTGLYIVDLKWAADSDTAGPSVYTAIQEQLGLKLEPTRGQVPVLVIDHVEKPSEN